MAGSESLDTLREDSKPIQRPQQQEQRRPADSPAALKVGIFHADTDLNIARRLADSFKAYGCNAELFDFQDAGQAIMKHLESFITSQNLVLWIATKTSLNNDGILEAASHIAQYAGIDRKELGIRFAAFKPKEHLSARLPLVLDAYSKLIEDAQFTESMDTTIKSVRAKMAKRRATDGSSTASTNPVGGNAPDLSLISPASDRITEPPQVIVSDAPGKSAATPFPTYDEASQGQGAQGTQRPQAPDDNMYGPEVANIIPIHDSNVRALPPEKKKPKSDDDEGTPV